MARNSGSPIERFLRRIQVTPTCWLWQGPLTTQGYGQTFAVDRVVGAHRFAFEFWVCPIPEGLHIDHLCRIRHCVNPDHMEVVTPRENVLRGEGTTAVNARKTECKRGHPLSGDNLILRPNGARQCRTCTRQQDRVRRAQVPKKPRIPGTSNAKLAEHEIVEIRRRRAYLGTSANQLAAEFNVSPVTVRSILNGRSWWWVP